MSKSRRPSGPSSDPGNRSAPENRDSSSVSHGIRPLKPRRTLFAVLAFVLIVWLAVLLLMYFKTVYPLRHGADKKPTNLRVMPIPRGQ
ncbi:MAG TPA: hypothetical protein VFW23_13275 [Tepidisphaeraceae bacterium]|nr:hypothetical protein [Tepidisphaeraceae bacterium]